MKKHILTAILMLTALSLSAQEKAVVSNDNSQIVKGRVVDAATGQPLAGVIVSAYGNLRQTTMTGDDGCYELNVPGHVRSIAMRVDGYNMQQAARVSDKTGFFSLEATGKPGHLVEFDDTKNIFENPSKKETEDYINAVVADVCPNMCAVIGGPLSARLISLAGGLERLASLPSSTVQLLGAEKAMFRHLRSGKLPPKHGVIFQYPDLRKAPYWQRGNIARALAGKVLIAAKIDEYGGEFAGDRLNSELKKRIAEIKKKYPDPPKKKPRQDGGRPNHKGKGHSKGKGKRRP